LTWLRYYYRAGVRKIVSSLVEDIIMPPIGAMGMGFSNLLLTSAQFLSYYRDGKSAATDAELRLFLTRW